jgi:hypothetical protein
MYARVVRWEGADAEALDQAAAQIRSDSDAGPPDGVPAKEMLLLNDGESGRSLAIIMFETAEDYERGHETLESMSPPGEGMGERVSVEKYDVAVRVEA